LSYPIERRKERAIEPERALCSLFCQYSGPICRYLARLTGDRQRAEDLTQETFVRAYAALERGAQWDNPRAWLYRVASRLAINEHRRRKLIQWLPLWSTEVDPVPGVEATIAERLAVREALDALPLKYRIPLVLYASEGYSIAEVAAMLELSSSAVKVRLYRARDKFRRVYRARERQTSRDREAGFGEKERARANLPEEEQ
jgi:RNA polymerase sigma-70 factor (ECF subfamily)